MTTETKPAEEATIPIDEQFFEIVTLAIDEAGLHPAPGLARFPDGRSEFAMIVEPETAYQWFWRKIRKEEAREVIFGLDRYTEPNQGTEFADVITVVQWRAFPASGIRIGVINYKPEPRIVRPIDWNNKFWDHKVVQELNNSDPNQSGKR